jgi:hypothetical protein
MQAQVCKAEAACGVSHAHSMAVFATPADLEGFHVPPPLTIQVSTNLIQSNLI